MAGEPRLTTARRRTGFALATALAIAAIVPLVASAIAQNEWSGHVKGDPDSFVTFDVRKNDEGVRRVRDVILGGIDFTCEDDSDGQTTAVTVEGKFRVRDGRFGGERDAIVQGIDPRAFFAGKFLPGKRAKGTLRLRGELDPQGHPGLRCRTGLQEWRAEKQPPFPP
jgi:hypothetical protein